MKSQEYGGNKVKNLCAKLDDFDEGRYDLVSGAPYEYFILKLSAGSEYNIDSLKSFSVYVLEKSPDTNILISNSKEKVREGDAFQIEGLEATISVLNGTSMFLVAGTILGTPNKPSVTHTRHDEIYRVDKPWGYELWINGQHPNYAIKKIFITDKTKTSLQFHNYKQETNVLFSGRALLHFKKTPNKENNDVIESDIGNVLISAISSIDVKPPTLHRLEAVGNIILYEVSTPHLDDVIRVMDDTKRPNGRLNKEHGA